MILAHFGLAFVLPCVRFCVASAPRARANRRFTSVKRRCAREARTHTKVHYHETGRARQKMACVFVSRVPRARANRRFTSVKRRCARRARARARKLTRPVLGAKRNKDAHFGSQFSTRMIDHDQ